MAQYADLSLTARITQITVDIDLMHEGTQIGTAIVSGDSIADILTKIPPVDPDPEPEAEDQGEGNQP